EAASPNFAVERVLDLAPGVPGAGRERALGDARRALRVDLARRRARGRPLRGAALRRAARAGRELRGRPGAGQDLAHGLRLAPPPSSRHLPAVEVGMSVRLLMGALLMVAVAGCNPSRGGARGGTGGTGGIGGGG